MIRSAVLCGVNSRFSQTNPAIRSLALYAGARLPRLTLELREYQTAQPADAVARDLLGCAADLYAFSCYIWNRRAVLDIIAALRCMRPAAWIVIGGPEVSFDAAVLMDQVPEIDFLISGEGEDAFTRLLDCLGREDGLSGLADVPALTWRQDGQILTQAPDPEALDPAQLPFPYDADLPELADRLLYYESSRGCPFRCSYCLSALERRLRFRPLDQTLAQLDRFIAADVRLVKFVDRTFNGDRRRARAIWAHLARRRRERPFRTCFHFELAGDLLEDEDLALLADVPPGLFQFEIGVQSVHPATLDRINRTCDLARLFANVQALRASGRQHLHLDLIAGLPGESLTDVIESFDVLYRLGADQLQLGFLKLLPGTPILADAGPCGYRAQPYPPYEVLASRDLTAEAFSLLHDIEAVLEAFANSGHFRRTLAWLVPNFGTPFTFFHTLAEWIARAGLKHQSLSLDQRAIILSRLAGAQLPDRQGIVTGLLKAEHYESGRKDAPGHLGALEATATPIQQAAIAGLRRSRLPGARIRVEHYPFSLERLLALGEVGGDPEWVIYDLSGPSPVPSGMLPALPAEG